MIPVVQHAAATGSFPGLYAFSLSDQAFLDPKTLLITSQWYSQTVILRVDLASGEVEAVTPTDAAQGSWTLQVMILRGGGAAVGVSTCLPEHGAAMTTRRGQE